MSTCNLYFQALADYSTFGRGFYTVTNDRAILPCYGWTDLDLGHGLHVNKCGQMCFTNSPVARREVLRRLLSLNLDIATREANTNQGE